MAYCPPNQRRPKHRPAPRCTRPQTGTFCNHDCKSCAAEMADRAAENRLRAIRETDRLLRSRPTAR